MESDDDFQHLAGNSSLQLRKLPYGESRQSMLAASGANSEIACKFLWNKCVQKRWLKRQDEAEFSFNATETGSLGVLVQGTDHGYSVQPSTLNPDVVKAVEKLDVAVAFTMSSDIISSLIEKTSSEFPPPSSLNIGGYTIPVVESVRNIAKLATNVNVSSDSFICLCLEDNFALLWEENIPALLEHATEIESLVVEQLFSANRPKSTIRRKSALPTPASGSVLSLPDDPELMKKRSVIAAALVKEEAGNKYYDEEKAKKNPEEFERRFMLSHAVVVSLAIILVIVVEMACVAKLVQEIRLDGNYMRLALIVTLPVFAMFSIFFMIVITGSLFQLFGPLPQANSKYYSCIAPKIGRYPDYQLPHITIQMPVYKEGLKNVIIPTVESLLKAMKFYEEQGGTASIYINDDGLQLAKPEQIEARKAFYQLHHIGWCARPPNNTKVAKDDPAYFERRGKFKKASNMNYALDFSLRVDQEMERLISETCNDRGCHPEDLSLDEEDELYNTARDNVVGSDDGRTWADGYCKIGEVILIIDSDTRVPEDSLLYGALEMHESPEVALLQHASGIMQVAHNVFENGITYFTNLTYTAIQFAVGSGDCAPFVGHNTFIRWKAIQSIATFDEEISRTLFWSESHVSEDFDISLRLQMNGFIVRLATYHNGGFEEGVSLTVYDELARWGKYAYGCNELVFNPLRQWIFKGPFTRLFLRFLGSNIKITSKVTILAYIFTYYAVASAVPLALVNYLIVGWFGEWVDQFYIASWKIFVGMAVVFNLLSPLAYSMLRHRLGYATFFQSAVETAKWIPFFLLFFGGLSFHLFKALLYHSLSINMEWAATAKELEEHGFRAGLDRIVRDFKGMYVMVFLLTGVMIYLGCFAPSGWTITDFAAIVPLANQVGCHALLPFALGLF